MNRAEAYEILIQCMEEELKVLSKSTELIGPEISRTGKNGDLYTISLTIEKENAGDSVLKGTVRGNNPQKFEILEEEMKIKDTNV